MRHKTPCGPVFLAGMVFAVTLADHAPCDRHAPYEEAREQVVVYAKRDERVLLLQHDLLDGGGFGLSGVSPMPPSPFPGWRHPERKQFTLRS